MADSAPSPLPETLDGGRYVIERILGEGGNAVVLLAMDTRMGVRRAIKLLRPEAARSAANRARFKGEAHAQADLQHPNVLMVHDAIDDSQGVYLVMELAEKDSLKERVTDHGPLSVREVIEVGVVIGKALGVAHGRGLVHRDIKPANILVDRHGVLKLADFGIALGAGTHVTQQGIVMGTWAFMSPEQRDDSHAVDNRSDIYAFGITLYALLKGHVPPNPYNVNAWSEAFIGVPPALTAVIQRATRIYPEERYSRIEEMVDELHRLGDLAALEYVPPPADLESTPISLATLHPERASTTDSSALGGVTATDEPVSEVSSPPAPPPAPTRSADSGQIGAHPADHRAMFLGFGLTLAAVVLVGVLTLAGLWMWRSGKTAPAGPAETVVAAADPSAATASEGSAPNTARSAPDAVAGEGASAGAAPAGGAADPATALAETPAPPSAAAPAASNPGVAALGPAPTSGSPSRTRPDVATVGTPAKTPTIIVVNPTAAATTAPTVESATPVASAALTGRVSVTTLPGGAKVQLKGRSLSPVASGTYELPVGSHTLKLISSSGEETSTAVSIRAGATVEICYSFDTNSACPR